MFSEASGAISSLFFIYIIVNYLFFAFGLHKISELRSYDKPWLAFIPIANYYLLGLVADNINRCEYKRSNYRITLLAVAIIATILKSISNSLKRNYFSIDGSVYLYSEIKVAVGIMALIKLIFCFMALYKIYNDYSPDKAVLMLVCSIIFYFIVPFVLYAIRRNPSVSMQKAREEKQQTEQREQEYIQFNYTNQF